MGRPLIRALVLLVALGAARPARAAEIFAVVIGWNGGNARLAPLSFADDDAVRFAVFLSGLRAPAAPGRVWLLTATDADTERTLAAAHLTIRPDAPPTRTAVLGALAELARTLRAHPAAHPRVLYVVYAGHGLEGRLLLQPERGQDEAALTGAELRAALAEVADADPALRLFVFLDACRSESLFTDRGEGEDFGSAIAALERRARAVPVGVLTAARSGRPAGEVRALQAGYFSHVLTSGLAGAADADGDDVVSFGELAAFVAFQTRKLTGQMPWFDPPGGDLSVGAMDHRGRRARLQLPPGEGGRYLVGAAAGRPVLAEAAGVRGRTVRLALPPGHYNVIREAGDGRGWEADVDLGLEAVDLGAVPWRPRQTARGPDEAPVFSADFSPDVVSTLEAGYHAGHAEPWRQARYQLQLEAGVGTAPLGLGGAEPTLTVRLARRFRLFHLAAVARAATSGHAGYELRRFAVGLEAGRGLRLGTATVEAFAAAGWGALVRSAPEGRSGDLATPWAEGGARAWAPAAGPWRAVLSARLTAAWIDVDRHRELSATPAVDIGMGVSF